MSSRRNLSPTQRITIAKKHEEKLRVQAKENQLSTLKQNTDNRIVQTDKTEDINETQVRKEIAKIANVGTGTLARYEVVMKSDDEELKQKMLSDEIKINTAYEKLKENCIEIKPL